MTIPKWTEDNRRGPCWYLPAPNEPGKVHHPDGVKALLVCPRGHIVCLTDHTIADDGIVTPSVVCPRQGCTFHVIVKLEGWTPHPPDPRPQTPA